MKNFDIAIYTTDVKDLLSEIIPNAPVNWATDGVLGYVIVGHGINSQNFRHSNGDIITGGAVMFNMTGEIPDVQETAQTLLDNMKGINPDHADLFDYSVWYETELSAPPVDGQEDEPETYGESEVTTLVTEALEVTPTPPTTPTGRKRGAKPKNQS